MPARARQFERINSFTNKDFQKYTTERPNLVTTVNAVEFAFFASFLFSEHCTSDMMDSSYVIDNRIAILNDIVERVYHFIMPLINEYRTRATRPQIVNKKRKKT